MNLERDSSAWLGLGQLTWVRPGRGHEPDGTGRDDAELTRDEQTTPDTIPKIKSYMLCLPIQQTFFAKAFSKELFYLKSKEYPPPPPPPLNPQPWLLPPSSSSEATCTYVLLLPNNQP